MAGPCHLGSAWNRGPRGSVGKRDGDWAVEEEASPVWKLPWPSPAAGTSLGKFFPFHFHLSPCRYRRALSGLSVPDSRVSGLYRPPAAPLSSEPPREVEAGRRRPNPPPLPLRSLEAPRVPTPSPGGRGAGPGREGLRENRWNWLGPRPLQVTWLLVPSRKLGTLGFPRVFARGDLEGTGGHLPGFPSFSPACL